jgi:hypothetical protein
MEKLLGVFLPALISVFIKRFQIEDHNEKVIVAVLFSALASVAFFLGTQAPFSLEKFADLTLVYLGLSQVTYQISKGLRKQ